MMMQKFGRLATLRIMLHQMEREVGLEDLSSSQRDVYYAACLLADDQSKVSSDTLRVHPMLDQVPRSTFFRVLKELVAVGYLRSAGSPRSGLYEVVQ